MSKQYTFLTFFIYLSFFSINTAFCMSQAQEIIHCATRTISYSEFVDHASVFWQTCRGKQFKERINLLCEHAAESKQVRVILTNVPHRDGSMTNVLLRLQNCGSYTADCYDEKGRCCFSGNISAARAYLDSLRTESFDACHRRCITGTTAMKIWDALWEFCGAAHGSLIDKARYDDILLKAVLPYVCGHSWYMQFGYKPKSSTLDEYGAAVNFLTRRSVHDATAQYQHTRIYPELTRGLLLFGLPASISMGEYIKKLYIGWRYGCTIDVDFKELFDERDRIICKKVLSDVSTYVLETISFKDRVGILQQRLLECEVEKQNLFL